MAFEDRTGKWHDMGLPKPNSRSDSNPETSKDRNPPGHDPADARIFDVRISPHRSLSRRNFRLLMMLFAGVSIASGLPFILIGAWPVAGFIGLDVAILYLAFRANFRSAHAYEDIIVTPLELLLAKVNARGMRREWRFHPAWVRLDRDEHVEFGLQRIAISSRGRSVEIAGFLGPDAKASFASGLSLALSEARRGPRYS